MEALFAEISEISQLSKQKQAVQEKTVGELLKEHIFEMEQTITFDYESNLKFAAENAKTCAILSIYFKTAKYRNIIGVHDLLFPTEKIQTIMSEYNIKPLLDTLRERFSPFDVGVKSLEEYTGKNDYSGNDTFVIYVDWSI